MANMPHQYIERRTGEVRTERLLADRAVNWLYSGVRERSQAVFNALTSRRTSHVLGSLNFDKFLGVRLGSAKRHLRHWGVDLDELYDDPDTLDTPRKMFERRIRYWRARPMPVSEAAIVSPADSRVLVGSLSENSALFIKDKFFDFTELLGGRHSRWLRAFGDGAFCIHRLTPEKYHYNHCPVSGRVVDIYQLDGGYHSCNPGAVVSVVTPYSKNRRVVTVLDTDMPGGTGAGLVAMVEVVALMIGEIVQCYSARRYDNPMDVTPGMFLERGQPKSLFRPGSSTVVLLFEPGRMAFDEDLLLNQRKAGVNSRFGRAFGAPLVETEVNVRAGIGLARAQVRQ